MAPKRKVTRRTIRRRRRFAGSAIGLSAVAAALAGAALATGFTSEPELERVEPSGLGKHSRALKRAEAERIRTEMTSRTVLGVKRGVLESIADCESHGDPRATSSDGTYRGKYQFDKGTWASMGGKGDPAKAPELEQDLRAAALYKAAGSSPWPVCG